MCKQKLKIKSQKQRWTYLGFVFFILWDNSEEKLSSRPGHNISNNLHGKPVATCKTSQSLYWPSTSAAFLESPLQTFIETELTFIETNLSQCLRNSNGYPRWPNGNSNQIWESNKWSSANSWGNPRSGKNATLYLTRKGKKEHKVTKNKKSIYLAGYTLHRYHLLLPNYTYKYIVLRIISFLAFKRVSIFLLISDTLVKTTKWVLNKSNNYNLRKFAHP